MCAFLVQFSVDIYIHMLRRIMCLWSSFLYIYTYTCYVELCVFDLLFFTHTHNRLRGGAMLDTYGVDSRADRSAYHAFSLSSLSNRGTWGYVASRDYKPRFNCELFAFCSCVHMCVCICVYVYTL